MRFREGDDGASVEFDAFDTGLGGVCEVEGLAMIADEGDDGPALLSRYPRVQD